MGATHYCRYKFGIFSCNAQPYRSAARWGCNTLGVCGIVFDVSSQKVFSKMLPWKSVNDTFISSILVFLFRNKFLFQKNIWRHYWQFGRCMHHIVMFWAGNKCVCIDVACNTSRGVTIFQIETVYRIFLIPLFEWKTYVFDFILESHVDAFTDLVYDAQPYYFWL